PGEQYLDTYRQIIATIPTTSSLVFNCGIGVVRTTFSMVAALIIRRKQIIEQGGQDPYRPHNVGGATQQQDEAAAFVLKTRSAQMERDSSLLRLMNLLQKSLATKGQATILSLLSSRPQLLESLRTALLGNYDLILSLLSTLDKGIEQKVLVDQIIDNCDALVNLRENVLEHRVRVASSALLDESASRDHRASALAALERYFFLISFASYIEDPSSTTLPFSRWLSYRSELGNMINRLHKTGHGHFYVFSPVHDLSAIAKGEAGELSAPTNGSLKDRFAEITSTGGEVVGEEWANQIVRNRGGIILRSGMILKDDRWRVSDEENPSVRGAMNFRRVPESSLYGLSQPTQEGVEGVLKQVESNMHGEGTIAWINLREEPLLYINGSPFVLRESAVTLRNVKSYAGISSSRLELLEDRLKSDVLAELQAFDGRLLLHAESSDGSVNPSWELIDDPSSIKTVRELMDAASRKSSLTLQYHRIPITAEKSPDFSDSKDLVEIITNLDLDRSSVIVNCQLGRGRSTRAQVLITLVQRWLRSGGQRFPAIGPDTPRSTRYSYTVINNLLRTIRQGQEVKTAVDKAITECGETFDLLDAIEGSRQAAEDAKVAGDAELERNRTQRGVLNLRSFLNETRAETWREVRETSSYEDYVRQRPVFKTIERELDTAGLEALAPLEKPLPQGAAFTDEIAEFVAKRSGRILSAFTLLKSDFFAGLQKMSLPERVDGSPNFRRVPLLLSDSIPSTPMTASSYESSTIPLVYGSGMPTIDGLRRALDRMGGKTKKIVWTSMREEPVIYVSGGRPHVLRLFDAPLENVITTGVTTETVEGMEASLKTDLLREATQNDGKILLHDEIQESDGSFTVTAQWEALTEDQVKTPKEVFLMMVQEGYQVEYERLPVTDEQAPIPGVFTQIEQRVTNALGSATRPEDVSFVFNCQMGRGRTTTGMVAAALTSNILFNGAALEGLSASFVQGEHQPDNLAWDGRESDPLLNGEYKLILQLVSILRYGKLAKRLVDRCIDSMEGVQNLRKAVYDFKLRAEAAAANKSAKVFAVAVNYLYRYASLILFANFLLEKAAAAYDTDDETQKSLPAFTAWLDERRELKRILTKKSLD
ncbi:metal ion binding protein, partial [Pseudohyphozyma bogoriensis]